MAVTLPSTINIGSSITVEAETQNSSASSDILDNHLLQVSASDGSSTVQVKKTSGGTYADAIFYQVENYTGSKYGIQETVFFDLTEPDDAESTITVTVAVISMEDDLSGTDTMTAKSVVTVISAAGGADDTTDMRLFTIASGTWANSTAIPTHTTRARMANRSGTGYLTGGQTTGLTRDDRAESFSKSGASWSTLTSMTNGRYDHHTWSLSDNIYVAGTINTFDGNDETEEYTVSGDSWASKATMSTARHTGAFAPVGTDGYIFGGQVTGSSGSTDAGMKYDQTANSYSTTGALSSARRLTVGFTDGTDVWVTSGEETDGGSTIVKTTEKYSVAGDSFSSGTDHPTPARYRSGSGWSDTDGYLVGGTDSGGGDLADNDVYNFTAGTWSSSTSLSATAKYPAASGL